jgi:hypothetical protein
VFLKDTDVVGLVISKYTTFEVTPPFDTVTQAVPGVAMSALGTAAVNRSVLTKVVVSALPFKYTTDPETKPAPFTVRVKPDPPATLAAGTSG